MRKTIATQKRAGLAREEKAKAVGSVMSVPLLERPGQRPVGIESGIDGREY